ncbi:hypothetical protein Bca4012_084859 [Brassica carinata]
MSLSLSRRGSVPNQFSLPPPISILNLKPSASSVSHLCRNLGLASPPPSLKKINQFEIERGRDIQMGRKRSNRGGDAGTGMCGGGGDAWMSNEQRWCGGGCDSGKANKRTSCGGGDAGTATNGGRVVVVVMVIKDRRWWEVIGAFNFPNTITSASRKVSQKFISCD